MLNIETRQNIKNVAQELIDTQGLSAPFNVSSVAQSKGINVLVADDSTLLNLVKENEPSKYKKINKHEVVAYFDRDKRNLYLARSNAGNMKRKRFTVAHELGHYLLGHNNKFRVISRSDIYDFSEMPEEIAANYFAGYLLMPDKDILRYLTVFSPVYSGETLVNKLADALFVSLSSMRLRLSTFAQENKEWKNVQTLSL